LKPHPPACGWQATLTPNREGSFVSKAKYIFSLKIRQFNNRTNVVGTPEESNICSPGFRVAAPGVNGLKNKYRRIRKSNLKNKIVCAEVIDQNKKVQNEPTSSGNNCAQSGQKIRFVRSQRSSEF
jgi:hypothetical protein